MKIIPAIDLKDGKCVRLTQGKEGSEQVFSENPIEIALEWEKRGASIIPLVDLDGAFSGEPKNNSIVKQIVNKVNIPVQLGGGIRDIKAVNKVFDIGVERAIIGTSAVSNKSFVEEAISSFGEKIIIGIDAKNGKVAIKGWVEESKIDSIDMAKKMEKIGVKRIIYTDISKDGMMKGPNIGVIEELLSQTNLEIIASGGVSDINDIKKLKSLIPRKPEGAIIGKALYLKNIILENAIRIAEGGEQC